MRKGVLVAGILAQSLSLASLAGDGGKFPSEEYERRIQFNVTAYGLAPDLFGERVDLYNGRLSFSVTDIDIPGNSKLPVRLTRTFDVVDREGRLDDGSMADWDLDLPNVSGVFATTWHDQRCSGSRKPPTRSAGSAQFSAGDYWDGNHANMPGGGEMLEPTASTPKPTTGGPYVWVTVEHTAFSCLSSIKNGSGEGFVAVTADGTRYWFDWMSRYAEPMIHGYGTQESVWSLDRQRNVLYATRVEDRFGNWVTYSFSNQASAPAKLHEIRASDGRVITLTHNSVGYIATASDGTRTWTYQYQQDSSTPRTSGTLTAVILPDASNWSINFGGLRSAEIDLSDGFGRSCAHPGLTSIFTVSGSVTHPSGATGTFEVEPRLHGRTNVPQLCNPGPTNVASDDRSAYVRSYWVPSLIRKRLNGAGLGPMEWNYSVGSTGDDLNNPPGSWAPDPANVCASDSCAGTTTTIVTGPGEWARYTFGNSFQYNEHKLLKTETGTGPTDISRVEVIGYQLAKSGQPFATPVAKSLQGDEGVASSYSRPVQSTTITLDGATYTKTNSNWDAYAKPQTVSGSGPNGGSRTTQYTYYNNQSLWVIGQLASSSSTGRASSRTFYSNGKIETQVDDGVTTRYTYHADGTVATITYPRSLVHSFSNYKRGISQTESQPEGINLSRTVSDAGFVMAETDGEGHTKHYTRDPMGRLTSIDYPIGNDASTFYTGATKSTKTTTRGPLTQTVTYDALWRPTRIVLGGITTDYQYDAHGRRTFVSNPNAAIGTRYEFDALGRLKKVTHPDSKYRSITYGPGNITTRDERGNFTTRTYRSYGDPNDIVLVGITAPEPAANMTIGRAPNGLLTSITQAGRTRGFDYDTRNYLTSETHPETGTTIYERDDSGNQKARLIGGTRADFSYDGQNRLTGVTYSDSTPALTQTWSKTNKLRTVTSSSATRILGYDDNDNLTSESLTVGGTVLTAQYGYDGNDQRSTITYPISQRVISYSPDALGRPTQVSGYASSVAYWPSGFVQQINYVNGVVTNFEQNSRLWPSAFRTRRGSVYSISSAYGYDDAGNLTSIVDAVDGNMNRSLGYDGIDRLTSASGPWGSGTIVYDGAGNITSQNLASFNLSYAYDQQNRLSSVSGSRSTSYGYDVYGNISSIGSASYAYDAVPNLRCADCGSGNRTDYVYDGLRNRVTVAKSGKTTYEFYAFNGDLLVEFTPSQANKLVEHIYLSGSRLAQRTSDQNPPTAVAPARTSAVATRTGEVVLTVNVGGTSPAGTVTFSEGGNVLGTAYVIDGQASITVLGFALGTHTISATYSGDPANSGNTVTFQVKVIDLGWLPAVLDLLLN